MKNIFWIFLIIIGCKHKTAEQRYIEYINDTHNKIKQQIRIGEVEATIKWLPADYMKLMNKNRANDLANNDNNDFYYFDIKFDKAKGDKPGKDKIMYLDFDMQQDFVMWTGTDSIMPAICQKIENGSAGSYQYMLAFEKTSKQKEPGDFAVVYNDKIFGIGSMAFAYKQQDIQKIPHVKGEMTK